MPIGSTRSVMCGLGSAAPSGTETWDTTAEYTFTVPPGVNSVHVTVRGGGGATGFAVGGDGGYVECDISVSPGQTITGYVGGGGEGAPSEHEIAGGGAYGGGGGEYGGGGGAGVTILEIDGTQVVSAGGGGGGGGPYAGGDGGGGGGGAYAGTGGLNWNGNKTGEDGASTVEGHTGNNGGDGGDAATEVGSPDSTPGTAGDGSVHDTSIVSNEQTTVGGGNSGGTTDTDAGEDGTIVIEY